MKQLAKINGVVLVFAMILFMSGKGIADERGGEQVLYGDYSFSVVLNCASGPPGFEFNEDLSRGIDGNSYTVAVAGIMSFNGDGTGSASHRALAINHTATGAEEYPVRENDCNAVLSYTMNEKKTYTLESAVTCERTAGPGVGQLFTIHGIVREIRAGHGHHTLLISDTKPNAEILTFQNADPRQRICAVSGTAIKISRGNDD